MKIYLAGPINGCSDAECTDWRNSFKLAWPNVLDPMARDYRGKEQDEFCQIVEQDKADIVSADAILVYFEKPSVGTSMEILFAWEHSKLVLLVDKSDRPLSPWLRYHSTHIFTSISEAIEYVKADNDSYARQ